MMIMTMTCKDSGWLPTYILTDGLSEIPHLSSGRCTSFFILLFGYLMFQYYSASIVGTLLMEQPKSIKTLRNLIDSRLTLGIEDIPYSRDYFVRTSDVDSLELHRTRIEYYEPKTGRNESHFLPAADGLQLVRAGGYAFHVAISAAYRIIRLTFGEREICELSEIDMFPVWSQWMVAIVQKNSPYRDVITYGLRRLNEAGLMQRQRHVWQETKPKCVRQIAPTDLIVGLDAVVSAFVLLLGGVALSICVLVVEILCHRIERHRHGCRRELERNRFVMMTKQRYSTAKTARNCSELFYVE
uniref:Ionotropic glutamate receptor C-terminal domain-containing protein n=1 Tax=Anopheles farauti TaxID=69004 RepID=A0A182R077_9DIPT